MSSSNIDLLAIMYSVVVFGLIILFVVSFTLFIRRMLSNSSENGKKLDRIIELLENEKKV